MNKERATGVHLRIETSYSALLEQAIQLGLNACQFFFIPQETKRYLPLGKKDREAFLALSDSHIKNIFIHTSYWINAATGNQESSRISKSLLIKEILLAQKLNIKYLVLHGGTAKNFKHDPQDPISKKAGILALAEMINSVLKEHDITLLVENSPHGGKTVCSDLNDFVELKKLLIYPEKVKFCLDTAHAFSYGYDLEDTEKFISIVDQTMGVENIQLIHYNDSSKPRGSRIDEHALPGEGLIGKAPLERIAFHPRLNTVPLIIEPPTLNLGTIREYF